MNSLLNRTLVSGEPALLVLADRRDFPTLELESTSQRTGYGMHPVKELQAGFGKAAKVEQWREHDATCFQVLVVMFSFQVLHLMPALVEEYL